MRPQPTMEHHRRLVFFFLAEVKSSFHFFFFKKIKVTHARFAEGQALFPLHFFSYFFLLCSVRFRLLQLLAKLPVVRLCAFISES